MYRRFCFAILTLCISAGTGVSPISAADWPQFRGPSGNGIATDTQAPKRWSRTENIKWKVKLPQPGNGSPIVSGKHVYLACAEDKEGKRRSLYCFDRETGEKLWVRTVGFGESEPTHKTNPYCATTPASDGERVVVWHGSAGLYCYDAQGTPRWSHNLGRFEHIWGYATSPVIHDDKVILHSGPGKNVFVAVFDLKSGKELWRVDEHVDFRKSSRNAEGNYEGSWSTPVIWQSNGKTQVVCSMPTRVVGYDLETGKLVWWCRGLHGSRGDLAYSSPMIRGNLCVAFGGFGGPAIGLRLGGTGDVTESHRLWRIDKNPQSIGTGVFIGNHVYRVNAARPAPIECLEARTGNIVWKSDPRDGICWSSLVVVGKTGYVTNRTGTTIVFEISPKEYRPIARNDLGEPCHATPAVSDGEIFIRTWKHLYCIAGKAL